MKYLKLFEEFEPMVSPEIDNLDTDTFNRKKQDFEFNNRKNSDEQWLKDHPLVGVEIYNKPAVPKNTRWYMNDDGSYGYSVNFGNGSEYISAYSESKAPKNMICTIRLGYGGVVGKEELMSWVHSNMIYHNIDPMLREKILKRINDEVKEKDPNSNW